MTGPRRTLPPREAAELAVAAVGARTLYRAGARQVWVCGSLAHGHHWDAFSDLDFVTTGIPTSRRAALTAVLVAECGRPVDVIPLEDAPSYLRVQIVQAMIPVDRFGRTAEVTVGLLDPPAAPLTRRPLARGLHRQRHAAVIEILLQLRATRVVDLGCGRGELLTAIVAALDQPGGGGSAPVSVLGLDPDPAALAAARDRLAEVLDVDQQERLALVAGGVDQLSSVWSAHEALVAVEVLEHLDPATLGRLQDVVFRELRPPAVVLTTPSADFNALLPGRSFRDADHRFEWSREELSAWAARWAEIGGYQHTVLGVGDPHPAYGPPTQLVRFVRRPTSLTPA